MDPVELHIPVGAGRHLRAYRYGGDFFAATSDLATAFNMSRSGLRCLMTNNKITSVKNAELKEALGLVGKQHFLRITEIQSLLRLRLEDPAAAMAVFESAGAAGDEVAVASPDMTESPHHRIVVDESASDQEAAVAALAGRGASPLAKFSRQEPTHEVVAVAEDVSSKQFSLEQSSMPPPPPEQFAMPSEEYASTTPQLLLTLPPPPPLVPISARNRFLNLSIPAELKNELERKATDMSSRYSDSTERKMQLSSRVWKEVCTARKWDPMAAEVTDERLLEFTFLCLHRDCGIGYGYHTFRDCYLPALLQWFTRQGIRYSDAIHDRLKQKMKAMVKSGELSAKQLPLERGQEPITCYDLDHIARYYPNGCRDKCQVMSWMSVGLNTGARGISLESALWQDVRIVAPVEDRPDFLQITLVFRATKGEPNWYHSVTLEGSTTNACGVNAVYWLSLLVKQRLAPHDVELNQTTVSKLSGQVLAAFDGSRVDKATMSARLSAVGEFSGYPPRMISNHGLRAGFLCTTLLRQASDPTDEVNLHDVWTKAALVAGWAPNSRHQVTYCKQAFMRCIVASRLMQGSHSSVARDDVLAKIVGVGAIAKNKFQDPALFHGLQSLEPCWPESTRVQVWQDKLNDCITSVVHQRRPGLAGKIGSAKRFVVDHTYVQLAVLNGLHVGGDIDTPASFSDEGDGDEEEYLPDELLPSPSEARRLVQGWLAIRFDAESTPLWIDGFMSKAVKPIVVTLVLSYIPSTTTTAVSSATKSAVSKRGSSAAPPSSAPPEVKKAKTQAGSAKRVPWTVQETRVLCSGVVQHRGGKWSVIAQSEDLSRRTNMHCKDRMRNIMKQLASSDAVRAAEQWLDENPE